MSNKKQNYRQEYDEEERSNTYKKHPKHSPNVRGQGMRTLNSYVEEEDFDELEDDNHDKN